MCMADGKSQELFGLPEDIESEEINHLRERNVSVIYTYC